MTLLSTVAVLLLSQADPAPQPVDVSAYQDKLGVLTDGKGHYIAFRTDNTGASELFSSGDGKTFFQSVVVGGGRSGDEQWSSTLWDPRMFHGTGQSASFDMKSDPAPDGGDRVRRYSVNCAAKTTTVTPLSADDTKKLVAQAKFLGPLWTRMPEALLRDENGVYYLVDRFRSTDRAERRDFRVFVGPKGAMKQQPLKDIVDDEAGMIFTTKTGNLRLVTGREGKLEPKWVQGKEVTPLIQLDLNRYDTGRMIYLDLGPYSAARLGTPCDDFR